jgi:hypothetical protein
MGLSSKFKSLFTALAAGQGAVPVVAAGEGKILIFVNK